MLIDESQVPVTLKYLLNSLLRYLFKTMIWKSIGVSFSLFYTKPKLTTRLFPNPFRIKTGKEKTYFTCFQCTFFPLSFQQGTWNYLLMEWSNTTPKKTITTIFIYHEHGLSRDVWIVFPLNISDGSNIMSSIFSFLPESVGMNSFCACKNKKSVHFWKFSTYSLNHILKMH